jgi:hypothetical protein
MMDEHERQDGSSFHCADPPMTEKAPEAGESAEEFAKDWLHDQAILRDHAYLTGEWNALTRRLKARDQAIRAGRDKEWTRILGFDGDPWTPEYAMTATREALDSVLADAKAAQDKATRAEIAEKVCTCLALPHWKTCRAVELGILLAEGEEP